MINSSVFDSIATRTNGDIYLGVVGPVRCGKSTFISRFMRQLVVPHIENSYEQQRVIDELPQAADGTAVMTTQPKFVPSRAVSIKAGTASMRVRLIDCVGYMVDGVSGIEADGHIRNVKTPWSDVEIPFDQAAEIGTRKVIADHSTIAVVITTDGTITDIPRDNYVAAEEKVIYELKQYGKPFVVVVNSRRPDGTECRRVCNSIMEKFAVTVLPIDLENMNAMDINNIFNGILAEFPISGFKVNMPKWLHVMPANNEVIVDAIERLRNYTKGVRRIVDNNPASVFSGSAFFDAMETDEVDVATGTVIYNLLPKTDLYYRIISNEAGIKIENKQHLVAYVRKVAGKAMEYDKLKDAIDAADANGYGVVVPTLDSYKLDTPRLHRNGRSYGLKLRATAPSLHIIKVDVGAEVTPTIGTQTQSKEMLEFLKAEYETNKEAVWQTPIFGKSLDEIMQEGVGTKIQNMPPEAMKKMKRTIGKIVNNGKGGIICILL
jgi:stage IV sporulation protein A